MEIQNSANRVSLGPVDSADRMQLSRPGHTDQPAAQPAIDTTTLSADGNLAAKAMSVPDVRMDKVASIQQVLANGSYSVSADAVAGKLVDFMQGK